MIELILQVRAVLGIRARNIGTFLTYEIMSRSLHGFTDGRGNIIHYSRKNYPSLPPLLYTIKIPPQSSITPISGSVRLLPHFVVSPLPRTFQYIHKQRLPYLTRIQTSERSVGVSQVHSSVSKSSQIFQRRPKGYYSPFIRMKSNARWSVPFYLVDLAIGLEGM